MRYPLGPQGDIHVVLPTISMNAWLDQAIESVLSQDVWLHVILDGVPRPTHPPAWWEHPRVDVLLLPRRAGVSGALNRVIQTLPSGSFVARMDADDISLPGRFARQRDYLLSHPDVIVVATSFTTIDAAGMTSGQSHIRSGDVRAELVSAGNIVPHPTIMARTDELRPHPYDESLRQMEDYELWLRLSLVGEIHVLPEVLLQYRIHGQQSSRSAHPFSRYALLVARRRWHLAKMLGIPVLKRLKSEANWFARVARRNRRLKRAASVRKHS